MTPTHVLIVCARVRGSVYAVRYGQIWLVILDAMRELDAAAWYAWIKAGSW